MVEAEAEAAQDFEEGYINDSDPSVLRFLIASRWVRSQPRTVVMLLQTPDNR